MKKFKKQIVPIGDHWVSDKEGNRKKITITKERASKWVDSFNDMKSEGLNVYAPWEHELNSKPTKELLNAKNNGGKWTELVLEEDSIWGVVEAATESDAEKIGTTVEGCSIFVDDYLDGKGKLWEDSILHICLTNKPVAVTENFKPLSEENNLSIAMSTYVESEKSGMISTLIESLKKIGIVLPSTDDVDDLIKCLTVAIDNSSLKNTLAGGIPGNVTPKAPRYDLVMSTEVQESEKQETAPEPPKVDKTSEMILSQNESLKEENSQIKEQLSKFNSLFLKNVKQDLSSKIQNLKESFNEDDSEGKDLVKSLKAQLESTEFSFDEHGDVVQTPLHKEIDLHLKYAQKKEKKVEENSDKIPSNVTTKEVDDAPDDDPRSMSAEIIKQMVADMPL